MPENNKVMFNGQVVMDISDSTADANNMLAGTVGYTGAGVRTVGTATKGHTIKNPAGTALTQRDNLKFSDGHISDDSGNNQTIVDIVKEVTTAQWTNATEEGLYYINDKPDSIITAEQVAYGNGNVKTALDKRIEHITTTSTPVSQIKMAHSTVDITIAVGSQFNNVVNVSDITNGECDNANYILGVMAHTKGTTDIYVIGTRVSGTNQLVLRLGSAGGATALDVSSNNLPIGTYKFTLTVIYIPHSS